MNPFTTMFEGPFRDCGYAPAYRGDGINVHCKRIVNGVRWYYVIDNTTTFDGWSPYYELDVTTTNTVPDCLS